MAEGATTRSGSDPVLVFGEVHTCLVQNSSTLPPPAAAALLQLTPGVPVVRLERPVRRVMSPERATGVDCKLNVAREGKARAIGTVLSRAVLTGGRILQGSSYVTLARATSNHRQHWRHYLRGLGRVEVLGWPTPTNVVDGFLADGTPARGIDLSSISDRIIEDIQQNHQLDHHTALRASSATVRWAASLEDDAQASVGIQKAETDNTHVIRLRGALRDLPMLIRLCEEFALHEWLLTTVQDVVIMKAERDIALGRDPLESLQFALNHLVPLWMPPTYMSDEMRILWKGVEERTNYDGLFERQVAKVRDLRDQIGARAPRRNDRR